MNAVPTSSRLTSSERLQAALERPNGARFYRCALQVNPFDYLVRHGKTTTFSTEAEYNDAMVAACLEVGIEVIAVTDHYRVQHSMGLIQAARQAGIWAFGGFEAVTKDGVHLLCLFDPDKDESLERFIGGCDVSGHDDLSPTGSLDCLELLEKGATEWGGVCIAAHVGSKGGLLRKLSGQSGINAWKSSYLTACALPGPISDSEDRIRPILENKNADYKRLAPPAVINASDVNDPKDFERNPTSCFIKMAEVSIEGLRQAFLDPTSRVRLHSDPIPEPHAELLSMTWEGGFLNGTELHFNSNLNVLIGGRGTGKSTIVESIRYVLGLDPIGEAAQKAHEGVRRYVLQEGTRISLLVRSHRPSNRCYTIERIVSNPPEVKDEAGELLALAPSDVMPGVEVFGQHEISELTRDPEKLTLLLKRFIDVDTAASRRKAEVRELLGKSRSRIDIAYRDQLSLAERLATLPALEEAQKRFQEAGVESQLDEKSRLVSEERLFGTLAERLEDYKNLRNDLDQGLPLDPAFVSEKALDGLPNADVLGEVRSVLATLNTRLASVSQQFTAALTEADTSIANVKSRWNDRSSVIERTYEKLLRQLQASNVDGADFIQLRKQIEALRPLQEKMDKVERDLAASHGERRQLLSEWEEIKAHEHRQIKQAAKKVTKALKGRAKVEVKMAGNREPFEQVLREVGGNLSAAFSKLRDQEQLSLPEFVEHCRQGKEALITKYGIPPGSAEKFAQADRDLIMRIEELDLSATTRIDLNVAAEGNSPNWRALDALSTGQKATAVLLLLLLESDAPLIVDQPEDDLDNRFITEGIVPIMRDEKRRRQFVFSTHNANIPVLGDAELILGLLASGEEDEGASAIAREHMGSIDTGPVRELVEQLLEGGKKAFEMRRSKYGY